MNRKILVAAIVGFLQPILWWFIYNLLEPFAKIHDSVMGLTLACGLSTIVIGICCGSYIGHEYEKQSKK